MSNHDLIVRNETNKDSKGGTELLQDRLYDGSVPRELLEQFQIVFSRVRDLDESKYRIFYAHDLPGDPESEFLLDGWNKFHKLVFVSNWQMQAYINHYKIPWSHCIVIPNSIKPFKDYARPSNDRIKLIYTSTPHRGLNILYPVFDALSKKYDNIELDVFSSFKLYGWEERDQAYQELFEQLKAHPKINYHGTASNDEVRQALLDSHIFAYPSIWAETSCLCLIEAMAAGLLCVHPNFAALPETARGMTHMYQWDEDLTRHANVFYAVLDNAIQTYNTDYMALRLRSDAHETNSFYSWDRRAYDWTALLNMIVARDPDKSLPRPTFNYRIGA